MTAPIAAFLIVLALSVAALPLARLRFERRLRVLRANGLYPAAGAESDADVERLKRAGETVLAVRCYRAVHRVGLPEAHAAVVGGQKRRGLPAIFFLMLLLLVVAFAASRR